MKTWLRGIIVTLVLLMFFYAFVLAQPGDPGGDPDVPLGGLEYLIGLGALYGARQIMKKIRSK